MPFLHAIRQMGCQWILRCIATACLGWVGLSTVHAQDITVYSSGTITVGQTRKLTAYVPLSPNSVVWSVNGVVGGDAQYGTVSTTGLYAAPSAIPMNNAVVVEARSTAFPSKVGAATLTITQVQPRLWGSSPSRQSRPSASQLPHQRGWSRRG